MYDGIGQYNAIWEAYSDEEKVRILRIYSHICDSILKTKCPAEYVKFSLNSSKTLDVTIKWRENE